MKFHLFYVFTLCWLGEMCTGNDDGINEKKQFVRDRIYAVGEQFVDDFVKIREQNSNNYLIREICGETLTMLSRRIPKEKNSKIDVNQVKERSLKNNLSIADTKIALDYLKVMQSILSQQFPTERYNGVVNVIFTVAFNYATTEEIQSALNYLYGIDTDATKTLFMDSHNLPKLTSEDDCPSRERLSSTTIDTLRSFVNVKPQVMENFLAIREQFPCNRFAVAYLDNFVNIVRQLGGDERKINACMLKEGVGLDSLHYILLHLEGQKSILSTRLPDETIRGIYNFQKVTIPDTPIEEIERALEYLYEDVPKTECPTSKNPTLQAE